MSMHDYLERAREFEGVLELAPEEGGPFPEIAWGDHFFYYAPDGQTPQQGQPFATFVTKDYPDDALSELDRAGRWRLNIHVGRHRFVSLTGEEPRLSRDVSGTGTASGSVWDFAATDTVIPHPVYRAGVDRRRHPESGLTGSYRQPARASSCRCKTALAPY